MVSGYVFMVTKPDPLARIMRLAWPLGIGVLVINPVTLAVIHGGFTGPWWDDVLDRAVTGRLFVHLWFLACLILFVAAVPVFLWLLHRWGRFGIDLPQRHGAAVLTLGAVGAQMAVAGLGGFDVPAPLDGIAKYAWCFVLGLGFYLFPRAWEAAHKPGPWPLLIAIFLWLAIANGWAEPGGRAHDMLHG